MTVAVTGGTGFVGTGIVNALLRKGFPVRVLARQPEAARSRFNHPVEVAVGDVGNLSSLGRAFAGCEAVIHLVGIIVEKQGQRFEEVHIQGTENVVSAARQTGVRKLVHISAMGSSPDSPSAYGRSKALGEQVVRSCPLDWTILRPSVIFGPGDGFVSLIAGVIRMSPFLVPVIGSGSTRFMPVSRRDVARICVESLTRPDGSRLAFEVGGPGTLTLNEIYREIAKALGLERKRLIHLPLWYGRIVASVLSVLPRPPLTNDQLNSLSVDNIGDISRTVSVFGGEYEEFAPGIREYIRPASDHDPTIGI